MDYERLSSLDDRSSLTSAVQQPLNKIIFFEFFILYFRTEKLLKNIEFVVRIQDLEQLEKVFFFLVWIRMKLENEKKKKEKLVKKNLNSSGPNHR